MSEPNRSWCLDCCKDVVDDGEGPCPECGAPRLTEEEAESV